MPDPTACAEGAKYPFGQLRSRANSRRRSVAAKPKPCCPACGSKSSDWLLCGYCTDSLLEDLAELPGLFRDLRITHTRQSQFGGSSSSGDSPVPFDRRAEPKMQAIRNTLGTWLRTLDAGDLYSRSAPICTCRPYRACQPHVIVTFTPGVSVRSWCAWMAARIQRIRGHEAVEQMTADIHDCVTAARKVIDSPPDLILCGSCPVCAHPMYAKVGEVETFCRQCKRANLAAAEPVEIKAPTYDIKTSREGMLSLVEHQWVTIAECSSLLASFGLPVRADTISNWARADRGAVLSRRGTNTAGVALYRVGDVADLIRDAAARKAEHPTRPTRITAAVVDNRDRVSALLRRILPDA